MELLRMYPCNPSKSARFPKMNDVFSFWLCNLFKRDSTVHFHIPLVDSRGVRLSCHLCKFPGTHKAISAHLMWDFVKDVFKVESVSVSTAQGLTKVTLVISVKVGQKACQRVSPLCKARYNVGRSQPTTSETHF